MRTVNNGKNRSKTTQRIENLTQNQCEPRRFVETI